MSVNVRQCPSISVNVHVRFDSIPDNGQSGRGLPRSIQYIYRDFKIIFYRAHIIWNDLPLELRKIDSELLFAKQKIWIISGNKFCP